MLGWIERLKMQSKASRNRVAFAGALLVTFVITGAWLLGTSVAPTTSENGAVSTSELDPRGALSQFSDRVSGQVAAAWASFTSGPTDETARDTPADTATSTDTATSSDRTPNQAVIVPTLSSTTVNAAQAPQSRTILIGTSSSARTPAGR